MRIALPREVIPGWLLVATLLNGCTSLSGVGGETHYACPAPRGVQCGSVTANYLQSVRGDLRAQPSTERVRPEAERAGAAQSTPTWTANPSADSATPLYSAPRILKLWVAPWEDRDGVLHDAAFVFVPIDRGHWRLDHGRPAAQLESRVLGPTRPETSTLTVPANPATTEPGSAPAQSIAPAQQHDSDAR